MWGGWYMLYVDQRSTGVEFFWKFNSKILKNVSEIFPDEETSLEMILWIFEVWWYFEFENTAKMPSSTFKPKG